MRQIPPAEEPTERATKKRQCDRSHRSKERDECATRTFSQGRLDWKQEALGSQSEEQLGDTSASAVELTAQTPAIESSKGERQCEEDTDWRKERRKSRYCQGIREDLDYGRPP